jgi:hypothetical protein
LDQSTLSCQSITDETIPTDKTNSIMGCLPSQVADPELPELFGEVPANFAVQGEE